MYLGPGTHVVNNVLSGVKPTSYVDALALRHDIEYLTTGEKFYSDLRAAYNADMSAQGLAMKVGLISRVGIDVLTHLIPGIPKFHLNNSINPSKQLLEQVYETGQMLLNDYDLYLDKMPSFESIEYDDKMRYSI